MTNKELREYFSDPIYDVDGPLIQKILENCPDVSEPRIVKTAYKFMMEAQEEGVDLDPKDAVRLAEYFKPKPISELVAGLNSVGINTLGDLKRVLDMENEEDSKMFTGGKSKSAVEKAEALERYAAALTENPDIILLGRPVFWPTLDCAWLKLAFLCDTLTKEEQDLLSAMHLVADSAVIQTKGNIQMAVFDINDIHEK